MTEKKWLSNYLPKDKTHHTLMIRFLKLSYFLSDVYSENPAPTLVLSFRLPARCIGLIWRKNCKVMYFFLLVTALQAFSLVCFDICHAQGDLKELQLKTHRNFCYFGQTSFHYVVVTGKVSIPATKIS